MFEAVTVFTNSINLIENVFVKHTNTCPVMVVHHCRSELVPVLPQRSYTVRPLRLF